MSIMQSRRDFLKNAGKVALTASVVSALPVASIAEAPAAVHPFPYVQLDPEVVKQRALASFSAYGGCCVGVGEALVGELADKIGYPWNQIPYQMFINGAAGYGQQTLCGALGGAVNVLGMLLPGAESKAVMGELFAWYKAANLPITVKDGVEAPAHTVAGSVNCADSVGNFMKAAGIESMGDPVRVARCACVTADVAAKTVELLNIHFGFATAAAEEAPELAANEYIGVGKGFGGDIKVKVTMDGDKIAAIDVLEHGETAGISDPAFKLTEQLIGKTSVEGIDAVSGATFTSKGLLDAVANALAQVK